MEKTQSRVEDISVASLRTWSAPYRGVCVYFTAQTGAALRRLVRPCADWCGPAQTGAALRRESRNESTEHRVGDREEIIHDPWMIPGWKTWGCLDDPMIFWKMENVVSTRCYGRQTASSEK